MMLRQSFCLPCFADSVEQWDAVLAQAARIGYQAVEIWFRDAHFPRLLELAAQHGLAIASMCGHQSLKVGMNQPGEHPRIEAELRQSIDLAAQHRIPGLICFSGNRVPGQSDQQAMDHCVRILQRVAPYAQQRGVNLNMELLNSRIDHPGYQNDRSAWGLEVCQRVNSPNVKLLYDIYHMQIMEGDLIRTITQNIRWIGHFHTAGNPGRKDLDNQQELNYPAICRAIAQSGYDLYLAHEFWPRGDKLQALQQAYELCRVD